MMRADMGYTVPIGTRIVNREMRSGAIQQVFYQPQFQRPWYVYVYKLDGGGVDEDIGEDLLLETELPRLIPISTFERQPPPLNIRGKIERIR